MSATTTYISYGKLIDLIGVLFMKYLSRFDLSGRVALITGGAGLLGQQHAAALLEVGCDIVLCDVSNESLDLVIDQLTKDFGPGRASGHFMDVTRLASIQDLANTLGEKRIDILINNAAIDSKVVSDSSLSNPTRLEGFSLNAWNHEISVGLTGAFLCSQVFGSLMAKDGKGGVILNIASDLSIIAPDQRLYSVEGLPDELQPVKPVTYSVIKAGLVGLTKYIATYWAEKGIRANALSPGGVFNGQGALFKERLESLIPLGRMAHVSEYQAAVQFLCSDASAYMNGQNIVIDGGRSVW